MSTSPLATPFAWDLVASAYAGEITPAFEHYAAFALREAGLAAGAELLDVGCGPGTLTLLARRAGYRLCALDFSPEMIRQLRVRLDAEPGEAVEAVEGDGTALPYEAGRFDGAFSMFSLIFFPDRLQGLRELRRVVKPGGPVVVSSWPPMDAVPEFNLLFTALNELLPNLPAGGQAPLSTEESIRTEFAEAGFGELQIHRVVHGLSAPDGEIWFGGMERTLAPLALMRHRMGDAWWPLRDALRERVMTALGGGPVRAEMPAWLSVARG